MTEDGSILALPAQQEIPALLAWRKAAPQVRALR
jgi:hypothetical protein